MSKEDKERLALYKFRGFLAVLIFFILIGLFAISLYIQTKEVTHNQYLIPRDQRKSHSLSALIYKDQKKHQVIYINYWATWCGPCLKELPNLIEAQKKYKRNKIPVNFIFYNVDSESSVEDAKEFVSKNLKSQISFQRNSLATKIARSKGNLPYHQIIDKNNLLALDQVIYFKSTDEIEFYINKVLNEI